MAYVIGAVVLVLVFLSLFDPLLAIAAGAGIALGLGGTALWTHRSQLIHAVQRLLQALREPRRVHRRLPMVFVGGPIVLAGGICVRVLYESAVWDAVTAVLTGVILGGLTWLLRVRRRQAIHESVWRRVWRVVRLVLLLLLIGIDGLFLVAIVFAVAEASLPIAVAAIVLAAIGVAGALVSSRVSRAGTSPTGGTTWPVPRRSAPNGGDLTSGSPASRPSMGRGCCCTPRPCRHECCWPLRRHGR
jgi:hypothetical protein